MNNNEIDPKNIIELVEKLANKLIEKKQTLTCVESCTGGGIAYFLTEISGSSAWFETGFVTYSNQAKQELVGVCAQSLNEHGAVSEQVAREMAQGALSQAKADFSMSVTGVAGPTGGSAEKPVGTVCFAWASQDKILSITKRFVGDRHAIRRQSIAFSIEKLIEFIEK